MYRAIIHASLPFFIGNGEHAQEKRVCLSAIDVSIAHPSSLHCTRLRCQTLSRRKNKEFIGRKKKILLNGAMHPAHWIFIMSNSQMQNSLFDWFHYREQSANEVQPKLGNWCDNYLPLNRTCRGQNPIDSPGNNTKKKKITCLEFELVVVVNPLSTFTTFCSSFRAHNLHSLGWTRIEFSESFLEWKDEMQCAAAPKTNANRSKRNE